MGVPGPKLLDDERFTQDFTGISAPDLHHARRPGEREAPGGQPEGHAALLLHQPVRLASPGRDHAGALGADADQPVRDRRTGDASRTSSARAGPCSTPSGPASRPGAACPRLPRRPPDHYLRETMAATLARQDVEFDFLVQLQTDSHRMPIEHAGVRWPERLSRPVPVATLRLPRQTVRHAGAARLRPQPVLQSLALRARAPPAREPEPGAPAPLLGALPTPAIHERHSPPRADRGRGLRAGRGWSGSEAGEVAERPQAGQEEVRSALDRDELRDAGQAAPETGGLRQREGAGDRAPGQRSPAPEQRDRSPRTARRTSCP